MHPPIRDLIRRTHSRGSRTSVVAPVRGSGGVTRRRTFVLERHGLVYVLEVHVACGASPAVGGEIEAMLGSFRLL